MKNLNKYLNKIAALDSPGQCGEALDRICEALQEFGYCAEGTDPCSEIQRAINEYNTTWDACVKPWAKKCGRDDTNNDLANIPFWYGPGLWWGCVRGSLAQEKMSSCPVEVLDELAGMSGAFRDVEDDIFLINTDVCPDCNLNTAGRVIPQVVIPNYLIEKLPDITKEGGQEIGPKELEK
jgi:hypothetical protein